MSEKYLEPSQFFQCHGFHHRSARCPNHFVLPGHRSRSHRPPHCGIKSRVVAESPGATGMSNLRRLQLHDVELPVFGVSEEPERCCGESPRACFAFDLHNNELGILDQTHFETDEEAYEVVRRGKAWGALVFAHNYSESLVERTEYGQNVDDAVLDFAELNVKLDMSSELQLLHVVHVT